MSTRQPESPKQSGPKGPALTPARAEAKAEQADRLATVLRDNLKRRKAQARARREPGPAGHEG
jgi:hypothetical protein